MTQRQAAVGSGSADIGVYGLAVMGRNLARNLADHKLKVAVGNRSAEKVESLLREHPEAGFLSVMNSAQNSAHASDTQRMAAFVALLKKPRTILIMVKAGAPTDAVIDHLSQLLEPGDIVVDGGNSRFADTIRREAQLRRLGISFVGMGVSGGEVGALTGPSLMVGGSKESYKILGPMLEKIAAKVKGDPCVAHLGSDGAGHYVKMVHNGIEYADMQLIGEAYDLLRLALRLSPEEIGDIFGVWNRSELESYLIEITAEILKHVDSATGRPFVDIVLDQAGAKGTGAWTGEAALELGVPASGIAEAVFARSLSSEPTQRKAASGFPGPEKTPVLERDVFVETVRHALYVGKILAYAQGLELISAGSQHYGWNIDLGTCARIWRGGCIIRAAFLDRVTAAYGENPDLPGLFAAPDFRAEVEKYEPCFRRAVAAGVAAGVPLPVFSSLLAYYDGLRAERLPAALIQAQRDFFGAHTYRRVDRPGTFHTLWSGDLSEVDASSLDIH